MNILLWFVRLFGSTTAIYTFAKAFLAQRQLLEDRNKELSWQGTAALFIVGLGLLSLITGLGIFFTKESLFAGFLLGNVALGTLLLLLGSLAFLVLRRMRNLEPEEYNVTTYLLASLARGKIWGVIVGFSVAFILIGLLVMQQGVLINSPTTQGIGASFFLHAILLTIWSIVTLFLLSEGEADSINRTVTNN